MASIALHPTDRLLSVLALAVVCAVLGTGALLVGIAAADEPPEIDENRTAVDQGDTAEIALSVPDGDTTQVRVRSPDDSFHLEATVTDESGDGSVTLQVDTEAITDEQPDADVSMGGDAPENAVSVAGDDTLEDVTVHETPETWALPGGDYDVTVGAPDDPADIAVLSVTPQVSVETHDEPISAAAGEPMTISGETLLGPDAELRVSVRSTGDSPFLTANDTTVDQDGTFTATLELPEIEGYSDLRLIVIHDGTEKVSIDGVLEGDAADDDQRDDLETDDRISIDRDGDELDLEAAANQTISGSTELDPGTTVYVRIRTTADAAEPFLKDVETTVDDDGEFAATFDLSDQPGDTPVTVQVRAVELSDASTGVHGVIHTTLDSGEANNTDDEANNLDIDDGTDDESGVLDDGSVAGIGLLAVGGLLAVIGIGVIARGGPSRFQ